MRKLVTILSLCVLISCSTAEEEKLDETYHIYTTVYPLQYFVERLGGNDVKVSTIYPPGADSHTYEPTTKTMTELAKADAFFYFGKVLEPFAESVAHALDDQHVRFIELGSHEELFKQSLERDHSEHLDDGHAHGDHDPHIWLDPLRALTLASILKEELILVIPERKQEIEDNFNILKSELIELDEQYRTTLKNKKDKTILVSHAGYGYWEERYGIKQLAVNGVNNSAEPSQADLIHLIEEAHEHHLSYMVFEQNISDSISLKIQSEMGIHAAHIHNLAVRTESDIEKKEDYFSLMRQNLKVLNLVTK
ncbi:metal ABC transporter solute-binding protein, Zn/Mn family [Radiobacillus deserti]|uniref:metal ABC transporter solute-binding protein, Zn/Mn family n=1 Tax=Radiobacillus deserti TaxID=2594883 RepID=UPI001E4F4AE4|nr:zinc ABC transporter substrate-binding protein [Radiobacillus deserti]